MNLIPSQHFYCSDTIRESSATAAPAPAPALDAGRGGSRAPPPPPHALQGWRRVRRCGAGRCCALRCTRRPAGGTGTGQGRDGEEEPSQGPGAGLGMQVQAVLSGRGFFVAPAAAAAAGLLQPRAHMNDDPYVMEKKERLLKTCLSFVVFIGMQIERISLISLPFFTISYFAHVSGTEGERERRRERVTENSSSSSRGGGGRSGQCAADIRLHCCLDCPPNLMQRRVGRPRCPVCVHRKAI